MKQIKFNHIIPLYITAYYDQPLQGRCQYHGKECLYEIDDEIEATYFLYELTEDSWRKRDQMQRKWDEIASDSWWNPEWKRNIRTPLKANWSENWKEWKETNPQLCEWKREGKLLGCFTWERESKSRTAPKGHPTPKRK